MRTTSFGTMMNSGWFAAALQALIFLDHSDELLCSSATLADQVHTHAVSLRRIMAPLVRADIVEAHEGRDGGYQLARPLERITLADLYRALNATPTAEESAGEPSWNALLPLGTRLALDEVAAEAEEQMLRTLATHTVANIATRAHRLAETSPLPL